MFQTYCYWIMSAITNDPRRLGKPSCHLPLGYQKYSCVVCAKRTHVLRHLDNTNSFGTHAMLPPLAVG